jgi:hypothetical protein
MQHLCISNDLPSTTAAAAAVAADAATALIQKH